MTDNYYEELGVEPGASRDELRDAHRRRVADLETARERKGISDSQLQANRDEVARVRAAWNVLSDPFQRQRYDARLDQGPGEEVELVDDDEPGPQPGTEPKGWRKILAPPPPPKNGAGNGNGNGKGGRNAAQGTRRPRPEPSIAVPEGMRLAEPRTRGMALLFDIAVLIVIFFGVSLILPRLVQSNYNDIQDRVSSVNDLHDARQSLSDAQQSANDAKGASDTKSAQSDLKSAQNDYNKALKDAKDNGAPAAKVDNKNAKQLQTYADDLTDKIKTTGYITTLATLILGLLYLVPITAKKGYTLGMRGRRIRVVRVDGSPCGWYAALVRFSLPLLLAVAIPSFGPILGLGMVAWAYFDRNGQGLHDKLARTIVVDA